MRQAGLHCELLARLSFAGMLERSSSCLWMLQEAEVGCDQDEKALSCLHYTFAAAAHSISFHIKLPQKQQ